YTIEAYRLYWRRLTASGMLSTSRWLTDYEAVRLAHLLREALAREGVPDPAAHVIVARGGDVATVIATRVPVAGALGDSLAAVCARRGFDVEWPARGAGGDVERVLRAGIGEFRGRGR